MGLLCVPGRNARFPASSISGGRSLPSRGQALFLLPWLWLPLMLCLARAVLRGPADELRWLMVCLAIGPIVLFTVLTLTGTQPSPIGRLPDI